MQALSLCIARLTCRIKKGTNHCDCIVITIKKDALSKGGATRRMLAGRD